MTSPDSSLSQGKNTLYAMVATFANFGTRDMANDFPRVPVDMATGHRYLNFEGPPINPTPLKVFIVNRAVGDAFICPGVNLYFGDPVASRQKDLPQRMFLPAFIHVMVPYTDEHRVGEAQAERLSELVQNAFEGIGGRQQMFDFYASPATALMGRFVSWSKESRGQWRELGDPNKGVFTNRQWTFQVRYVR